MNQNPGETQPAKPVETYYFKIARLSLGLIVELAVFVSGLAAAIFRHPFTWVAIGSLTWLAFSLLDTHPNLIK